MSSFLSTMTTNGRDLLGRLREAGTSEEVRALIERYQRLVLADFQGGSGLSEAC